MDPCRPTEPMIFWTGVTQPTVDSIVRYTIQISPNINMITMYSRKVNTVKLCSINHCCQKSQYDIGLIVNTVTCMWPRLFGITVKKYKSKTNHPTLVRSTGSLSNFTVKLIVLKVEALCYSVKTRDPSCSGFVTIHSHYRQTADILWQQPNFAMLMQRSANKKLIYHYRLCAYMTVPFNIIIMP